MMLRRIGRIALPPWVPLVVTGVVVLAFTSLAWMVTPPSRPYVSVAFIGNSMIYYNDFPRFLEELSDRHVKQDSCLHGNADLSTILVWGSGMAKIWNTGAARTGVDYNDSSTGERHAMYDYGACTVAQLLFGVDEDLDQRMQDVASDDDNDDDNDDNAQLEKEYGDDYFSYNDGSNPCLTKPSYYDYLQSRTAALGTPRYDYVVLNDNTRSPARNATRQKSLQVLEQVYLPWLLETGATPIFLCTYAYWTPYRDMTGLGSVPEFTALTLEGYRQYQALLAKGLPKHQQPRLAPVGLAFLMVYEENYSLWKRLFHVDQIHASPMGTFLQGCVVHHTIFGVMPTDYTDLDMYTLFMRARRFQPGIHRRTAFPTAEEAAYLYHVAARVVVYGQVPHSFVDRTGEAADYDPVDDLYKIDDLF